MKFIFQLGLTLALSLAADATGASLLLKDRQQIVMLGDSLSEGEDPDGYVNTTRLILAELYPGKSIFIAMPARAATPP